MPNSDRTRWPVDPKTGQPLPPRAQPGYYPGFSTLSQKSFWDEATRNVVMARVEKVPPVRFFSPQEAVLLQAVCDRILPQDDRDEAHKIPVLNFIDDRLYNNRLDGYRYQDMPPDQEAHRLGLQGIEAVALHMYGQSFIDLGSLKQDSVLKTLHDSKPPAGETIWQRLPVHRYWFLLVQDVVDAYYAHPYAWDEIGFGGPAYPRGYMRLARGEPEPWEVREQRYEWKWPPSSLSGGFDPIAASLEHEASSGQGGKH
ncbi:MAG TPA: gluconate 2-dehydrogenase subunit 3 family protein [Terriglobia bacterium]|nr:gluconate 2-dehydrogenase subunit 3 family protein [Terriglobia bacterium]